jgi:hypothetical protein
LLIPDIQETAALVQSATFSEINLREEKNQASNSSIELPIAKTIENRYLEIMKKLQFGKKIHAILFKDKVLHFNFHLNRYIRNDS